METLNIDRLKNMLILQDQMNSRVNPDWMIADYDWMRAVVIEGAEAIEHYGWKWWKKQELDLPQLQMELVDIWHFYLSHYLVRHATPNNIIENLQSGYLGEGCMFNGQYKEYARMSTLERLELMIGLAVARTANVKLFETLLTDVGMSWDDLYKQYIGKNVLNMFRQDHGYREGTYIKIWAGKEDNVHLANTMKREDRPEEIYAVLKALYEEVSKYQKVVEV